jgi:hypothetical protein
VDRLADGMKISIAGPAPVAMPAAEKHKHHHWNGQQPPAPQ